MKSKVYGLLVGLLMSSFTFQMQGQELLPCVDFSMQKKCHTIIAKGTPDFYNGHPTTVLMGDNKTIYCTWSHDHGGQNGFLSVSNDGGITWKSLSVPEDWKTSSNCPSIYRLADKAGKERLFIFSGSPLMAQTYSEDNGKTWSPVKSLNMPNVMAFASIVPLKDGRLVGLYHRGLNDQDRPPLTLWQSISADGGLTWGSPVQVGKKDGKAPCEPCVFRSPDGKSLVCIARENSRKGHSLMMFSNDEAASWTEMRETPWGLTGDRHVIRYLSDGRIIAAFRDMASDSPTKGHFVAWVGTYNDIINGYSGQYRIKLLHSFAGADCGYPGLEVLPDDTIVATTYIKYAPGKDKHSIVSVRFNIKEADEKVRNL